MNTSNYFSVGGIDPQADKTRQAVRALGGYAYQCVTAASAWINIKKEGRLYLEVAEDYALLAKKTLYAKQVKDTKKSGPVTLNDSGVRKAIQSFVDLVERNPEIDIQLHFMTTS